MRGQSQLGYDRIRLRQLLADQCPRLMRSRRFAAGRKNGCAPPCLVAARWPPWPLSPPVGTIGGGTGPKKHHGTERIVFWPHIPHWEVLRCAHNLLARGFLARRFLVMDLLGRYEQSEPPGTVGFRN